MVKAAMVITKIKIVARIIATTVVIKKRKLI